MEEDEDKDKLFWQTAHESPTDINMLNFVYKLICVRVIKIIGLLMFVKQQ
jgi:hypothetical protein